MRVYSKQLGYLEIPKGDKSKDVTFVASGGQASVYITNDKKFAIKLYHDSQKSIPEDKVKELSTLRHPNIVTPIDLLYDNKFVGYYMNFVSKTHNLCELFPKAFKTRNNIDFDHRKMLVEKIMDLVNFIHNHGFLIVDLNADNVLINSKLTEPYFIDTDSYKTKNFSANAIQDIIRDRKIKNNDFNIGSDWFAFACLAFNLYVGIHPYGGKHPKYTKEENGVSVISQRLNANISVFDSSVKYPPSVDDFKLIPKRHYDWFEDVFVKGGRSIPPKADSVAQQAVPTNIVIIKSSDKLNVKEIYSFDSAINRVWNCNGRFIFKTKNGFYEGLNKIKDSGNYHPILDAKGGLAFIEDKNDKLIFQGLELPYDYFQVKDGNLYRLFNGILYKDSLINYSKTFFSSKKYTDTSIAAVMTNGLVYDKCLSVNRIISYDDKGCRHYFLKNGLEKYNLISAKVAGNFAFIMAKKRVDYHIMYDLTTSENVIKKSSYIYPNMISLNGIHLKLDGDKLSVFRNLSQIKVIDNTGLDDSCRLFTNGSSAYFYTNNKFYSVSTK